ncbi:MAG: ABC transporter ATP-binding protein [Eubacteriales bacterium]|nr:ABC transporter ATP-binding protein [Eubacteriales bacterium]
MEPVIKVKDLVKRYDEVLALKRFNMEVMPGEIFGLLGPNGSGKTTAINCILSLLSYEQGDIKVFGQELKPNSYKLKARIGSVPQNIAIYPTLNVRENIDFFCSLYIKDRHRRRELVDEAIHFVQLEKHAKFRASKLSGGLQRRLHIACGIAHKPDLVILDEPTVAVDAQSRAFILDGIRKLRDEGSTIIYTTHYLEEAEELCERFLILDNGEHIASGTLSELRELISTSEIIHLKLSSDQPTLLEKFKELPGLVQLNRSDDGYQMEFSRRQNGLTSLIDLLDREQLAYTSLYSTQPSLTEIFLSLTGKELRE